MIKSSKKCKVENCSSFVFGQGYCKFHYPKKPLKKITEKGIAKKQEKKERINKLFELYLEIWDERADRNGNVRCFETDTLMSWTVYKKNIICYSHQISKAQRPDLAFEKDNILVVLPQIHFLWESNPQECPKMYEYTQKLKKKYGT